MQKNLVNGLLTVLHVLILVPATTIQTFDDRKKIQHDDGSSKNTRKPRFRVGTSMSSAENKLVQRKTLNALGYD